jgi:type IV secretory pathway VirB9-like protein
MSFKYLGIATAVVVLISVSSIVSLSQAQVSSPASATPTTSKPEGSFRQVQRPAPASITGAPSPTPASNVPTARPLATTPATPAIPAASNATQVPVPSSPSPSPSASVSTPATARLSESDARALARVQNELSQVTQSLTTGAQVAVFPYRLNRIYQVDIKPGNFTTFMIPRNEPIRQFAVSNTEAAEIVVNEQANAAMLKLTARVSLSATIVTDRRAYFLTIMPAQDTWHQGVSWTYEDQGQGQGGNTGTANAMAATAGTFGFRSSSTATGIQEPVANTEEGLVGQPNFNYQFAGDADITPIAVWDNGRFTWIQFPNQVQSLPAVFVMGPDGPEVVNYVVQPGGKQIKVNRLMPRFLLRLGSRKVTVEAQ